MGIDGLTTREKSEMLARLVGRYIPADTRPGRFVTYRWYFDDGIAPHGEPDLYEEKYMALAWRVLNWANDQLYDMPDDTTSARWLNEIESLWDSLYAEKPAEAQTAWLDKVFTLAIEAGLVERP